MGIVGPRASRLLLCVGLAAAVTSIAPAFASANHDPALVELISTGPAGGNGEIPVYWTVGSTADGSAVFFETTERLAAGDTDNSSDVYQRANGATILVSTGPAGGNGGFDAHAMWTGGPAFEDRTMSRDASRFFFYTSERLTSQDTDSSIDIYERVDNATTRLVSLGPAGGNGPYDAGTGGITTPDGAHFFFVTKEQLTANDLDNANDVYERFGNSTTLVTTRTDYVLAYLLIDDVSDDGQRVVFTTDEPYSASDPDASRDVYQEFNGAFTLVSTGPIDTGSSSAQFRAASTDGARVFFESLDPLAAEDTDTGNTLANIDIYERHAGATQLVSTGPTRPTTCEFSYCPRRTFGGITPDGQRAFFTSRNRLVASDTDASSDLYERSGGTTTLLSGGGSCAFSDCASGFAGISRDGARIFIGSGKSLVAADADSGCRATDDDLIYSIPCSDVYERSSGTTTLVSTGPSGGNGAFSAQFNGASEDGRRIIFTTDEPLVPEDADSGCFDVIGDPAPCEDVYERFHGVTTLLSRGAGPSNGATFGRFTGMSDDGTRVFFFTSERLSPADTDSTSDIYAASTRPLHEYPQAAAVVRVALVPMLRQTISTTQCQARGGLPSTHGGPLSFSSCNPPGYVPGTAASVGPAGAGFIELRAVPGDPATNVDEADLALVASVNDVRNRQTGGDYNPGSGADVTMIPRLRLSDARNGISGSDSATTTDFDFPVPIGCAPTADPSRGSTCEVSSSADALVPDAIAEDRHTTVAAWKLWLFDSGTNGVRGDADDKQFAQQGIYVP